jgi:hypothetical protein
MSKVKKAKITPKVKVEKDTIFIRNVSSEAKKKFYEKAEAHGYLPREFFELLVKAI